MNSQFHFLASTTKIQTINSKDTLTLLFIALWSTGVWIWKQVKCSLTAEWIRIALLTFNRVLSSAPHIVPWIPAAVITEYREESKPWAGLVVSHQHLSQTYGHLQKKKDAICCNLDGIREYYVKWNSYREKNGYQIISLICDT